MKCQVCMQETVLPFHCPFCGGQFCSEHRLPENHACSGIGFARAQRQEQVTAAPTYNSYQYTYSFGGQPFKRKRPVYFSPKELKHISIAALLVVGIGFSIGLYGNAFGSFWFEWTWGMMAVFATLVTASFLAHEIAHKVIAQKRGLWAEFRLTTWGALLTFASVFLPFRLIAPGAMMIGGSPNRDDIVKISVAGPVTNILFCIGVLLGAFLVFPSIYAIPLFFAAYINAFIALFNLIPFGVLDGYKIFSFNKKVWAVMFAVAVALTIVTYLLF